MATRTVSFHTLLCDGCGTQFGMDVNHASLIEARAAAYSDGWRFPQRVKATPGESKTVNDVCPECVPAWQPQPAQNNWSKRTAGDGRG